ncbi:ribosome biogenesis protein tsr1 [Mactra antiquata]
MQQVHRSGPLKQQNKAHKHGKHRSKGQREDGGRVSVKTLSRKAISVKRKNDRKNDAVQMRKRKRDEAIAKKRCVGSSGAPPHCVAVIPLHADLSTESVIDKLVHCDDQNVVRKIDNGITHVRVARFKQRVEFIPIKYGSPYDILDSAKVADSLLLLLSSSNEGIDEFGESCLSCLMGQGMPSVTLVTQDADSVPVKKQKDARKFLQKSMERWFPEDKLHNASTKQECLLVLRHITSQKLRNIHYREHRSHLISEHVQFDMNKDSESAGTLKLTGYVRSRTLSCNRLVHISGLGDYQLSQIDVLEDPNILNAKTDRKSRKDNQDVDMEDSSSVNEALSIIKPDASKIESLDSEVIPDPMEGEQTWPTEEELAEADQDRKSMSRRVPKGTSDYQSFWIVDDETEDNAVDDDDDDDDDDDMDEEMTAMDEDSDDNDDGEDDDDLSESEEEYEEVTVEDKDAKYDEQMDMAEEYSLLEKLKQEKQHVMFPDEVDTPRDLPARTRFQKYRGLKSFRTSPWDAKENLPLDYAKIFQFQNFKRMSKKILNSDDVEDDLDNGVTAWSYVRLHVANVPKNLGEKLEPNSPVAAFSLLPHEQKMSVVNIVLRKSPDVSRPIKSKDKLIFQIGYRRFSACPIFSQHTNANKHKFERFLPQDTAVVATMYAPISFPPAPVLVFQERPFGGFELVAKGSLLSVDPDRIITKRVVLSGYPFKINKKSCVVRYMFFNREDINWFKPVELRTKWGRRGHIKEPLGTHGHMKCIFDGQLKSQDTILMVLYKRVFPKWNYSSIVNKPMTISKPVSSFVSMETIEEEKEGAAFALFD